METYLFAVLDGSTANIDWFAIRSVPEMLEVLPRFSKDRLHDAASVIQKARAAGIKLSRFSDRISQALDAMEIVGFS